MGEKSQGQVIVRDGGQEISHLDLAGGHMVFGRTDTVEIQLPSASVSRKHAELFSDPFGRWWVRDLGSRNGTLVNGKKIDEHLIETGDIIRIETFDIEIQLAGPVKQRPRAQMSGTNLTIADVGGGDVTQLDAMASPKIDREHIKLLTAFAADLLTTEDDALRLQKLCQLMVAKDFHGNSALALRLQKGGADDQQPELLCEPVSGTNWRSGDEPYISRTMLRNVLATESPVVASNVSGPGGGDVVEMSLAASVMEMAAVMCPIASTSDYLDAFYVQFPAEYGTPEWLSLAALAAEQFQQADAAWDARRRAQQQAVFEKDLEQAEKIQSGLIPLDKKIDGLEIGIGFIPCRWVGGDYVDAVEMPDGRILVTICDVCGKGMQAALVTACLHTLTHMNATTDRPLDEIMGRINEYLVDNLPDESFATGIGMILDAKTGRFDYCNAGHPPAMIAQPSGEVRHLDSAQNPPLGYVPVPYEIQHGELAEGEMLALFTDGYTELNNEDKEMLGIEGIDECLRKVYPGGDAVAIDDMKQRFHDQLHAFQGNAPAMDDLTFIVLRRN